MEVRRRDPVTVQEFKRRSLRRILTPDGFHKTSEAAALTA